MARIRYSLVLSPFAETGAITIARTHSGAFT